MKSIILLNVTEVAKILGLSKLRVIQLIRQQKLKGIKLGGSSKVKNTSKYKIFSSDLEDYLLKEYQDSTRKFWDKRFRGVKK